MADPTIEKDTLETPEARLHNTQIKENYKKLFEDSSRSAAPVRERSESPVRHLFDETAPIPKQTAQSSVLFEGVTGKRAEPVVEPIASNAGTLTEERPAVEEDEGEDARPTPRTMAVLDFAEADIAPAPLFGSVTVTAPAQAVEQRESMRLGFFSALSSKMKVALLAVATAIVALIIVIGINTAVIASMDAQIAAKQGRLNEVTEQARKIEQQIEKATDPDTVGEWAQQHGMSYGG